MANISKTDLVKELAEKTGMGQKDVKTLVEGMLERVAGHLKGGDKVQLTGFGTFEVRERSARTGVKPGTTKRIEIAASKYPAFKAGKPLRTTSPSVAGQPQRPLERPVQNFRRPEAWLCRPKPRLAPHPVERRGGRPHRVLGYHRPQRRVERLDDHRTVVPNPLQSIEEATQVDHPGFSRQAAHAV